LVSGHSEQVSFEAIDNALSEPDTDLRLFGKPKVAGKRRMGVALARADSVTLAREKAQRVVDKVKIDVT